MNIICPAARGNGAFVLHRRLEQAIEGYEVRPFSPLWELFPPAMRWFSRGRADLVHAPADYGMFSRRRNVPQVLTLHGYNLDTAFRPFSSIVQRIHYSTDLRWIMRRSLLRATAITAVSRFTADLALRDLGISRDVRIIRNGVDVSRFTPARRAHAANVRVLFSGNLSRRKGAHLLPAIADQLASNVRLVCAAGLRGNEPATLRHPKIEILGSIAPDEMAGLYRSVDMLLLPSFREGLSLAVLEAMASGLPVVASDAASIPEQVHQGRGGYLCTPGAVQEFAARINELAASSSHRLEMGEYNRSRAETEFNQDGMVREYRELFESVLSSR